MICGLVPLIIGLLIFFTWWLARAFFAIDLDNFEGYGFFWIFISVPIATLGLLLLIIFLFKNSTNFIKQSILGLLLVLINIPTAYWILKKQGDLGERAYIKIQNNTKQDNVELTLTASYFEKKLGTLNDTKSLVDYYSPGYLKNTGSSIYPMIDSVTLIVKGNFPTLSITCHVLIRVNVKDFVSTKNLI